MVNRCEVFEEADLDAAIARFEQLNRPEPRLENAASRVYDRMNAYFAARDWLATTEILADDVSTEDRRRVVNSGLRQGRDAVIAEISGFAEIGVTDVTSDIIATRGGHLVLIRARSSGRDQSPHAFQAEVLHVVEIDADERIAAVVVFDIDDFDVAIAELDARYLAGEAAAHKHTWSVITQGNTAANRHETLPTTPDCLTIDHRLRATLDADGLTAYLRASWDLTPDLQVFIESVHRLSDLGAVVAHTSRGTSHEDFDAEWRQITLLTVEGDLGNRCEIFDEADIDAALTRFEELHPQTRRLENAASQVAERFMAHFAAGGWDAQAEMLADNISQDDRRRVVGAGVRHGRDAEIVDLRAIAGLGITNMTSTVMATRGGRLVLLRIRFSFRDQGPEGFLTDVLGIVEINADERIAALVTFDPDDVEAAVAEFDARYIAGEAAPHAQTWSVIAAAYGAVNRHEVPATTSDWNMVDHRPIATFESGDLPAFLDVTWALTSDIDLYVEAVHRLSDLGAVVTHTSHGTSQEGLDVEWHDINVVTVDGDLLDSCEIFDQTDIDGAIARFDELHPQAPRLENAASRVNDRFFACFAARNWAAIAEILADGSFIHDRRRVVNAGLWDGRDVVIANMQAVDEAGSDITSTVIATRGERLVLTRICSPNRDPRHGEFGSEMLGIAEIDDDERIVAHVVFEPDDIDAVFEELDARYLAGEAAAHAHTWSVIAGIYAGLNRRELPPTTPDWVNVDRRRVVGIAGGDLIGSLRGTWDLTRDFGIHIETVHRLTDFGTAFTYAAQGTSQDGLDVEWRDIMIVSVEGDLINHCELFDEADIDAALARFDELDRRAPLLENTATRTWARLTDAFNHRDMRGLLALSNADGRYEDRRKGLRDVLEGPARRKIVHSMFETAPSSWRLEVEPIAIRGSRLSLARDCYRDIDDADRPIVVALLRVMEFGDGGLTHDTVIFDPDDLNDAFAELTARWIASGEVAHPEVIESARRLNESANRHDWDAIGTSLAGATYVNHRQLASAGADTIADYLSSMRMLASRAPDLRTELAEILTHSAKGLVALMVLKGTSTDSVVIEIPIVQLTLLEGDHVTHLEAFDPDQRDLALARFEELSAKSQPK